MKKPFLNTILALSLFYAGTGPALAQNTNPGFEDGLNHWTIPPTFAEQISIEKQTVRSGTQALRIDAEQKPNSPFAVMVLKEALPGVNYRFSVWARVAPGSPTVQAALKYELYNAQGVNNGGDYSNNNLAADGEWKQISVLAKPQEDTVSMRFYLRVFGKSIVLFDDAAVEIPDLSITHPLKSAVDANTATEIKYNLVLGQEWNRAQLPEIQARLTTISGNEPNLVLPSQVQKLSARQFQATVTLPALAEGDYNLHFQGKGNNNEFKADTPVSVFTKSANRKPEYLSETGTLLHNGTPFFPIGMYHPIAGAVYGLKGPLLSEEENYKLLAENGFNSIQGNTSHHLDSMQKSLDLADKYGLAVDVPLYQSLLVAKNLESSLLKIKRFASHPAVLNWKIIDEPDLHPAVAHEVPGVYRALKAADSRHPIELTLDREVSLPFWSHYSDIIQIDRYPVPNRPLTLVSDFTREAYRNKQPWQNLQFVVQSGWTPDMKTQPTPAQARSMVYLALIEGAKGIWWYSMYDPGWDLTKTPFWPHLKAINNEIAQLSQPVMLGKTLTGITSSNDKLHFRAFEHENKTYLLVTNPHAEAVQGTLNLPQGFRSWKALNGGAANTITNHQLTVSFEGIDSQTYVLE